MNTLKKLLIACALVTSTIALGSTWEIDSAHASANFTVAHLMVSRVTGRLGSVKGTIELDDKDVTKSKVDATIDLTGLNTNVADRDTHLRSPDFFNVEKFPSLTFKSTKIEKADKKLMVTGDLTIRGTTKPITLETEVTDEVANPFSNVATRAVFATGTINREDFGLTWNKPMANNGIVVGKEVKVSIEVELKKAGPAPKNTAKK